LGSLAEVWVTRQASAFWFTQLQTDSSGVGGSVELASSVALTEGHVSAPGAADDADDWEGVVGVFVALYCVDRRV
jgi:hypothetical protein